jgi:hypothetical protein
MSVGVWDGTVMSITSTICHCQRRYVLRHQCESCSIRGWFYILAVRKDLGTGLVEKSRSSGSIGGTVLLTICGVQAS